MPRPSTNLESNATPEASASAPCPLFLAVPLTEAEWLDLIKRETARYPEIFRFNIENKQWELIDQNLVQLAESIERVRRILGAKLSQENMRKPKD